MISAWRLCETVIMGWVKVDELMYTLTCPSLHQYIKWPGMRQNTPESALRNNLLWIKTELARGSCCLCVSIHSQRYCVFYALGWAEFFLTDTREGEENCFLAYDWFHWFVNKSKCQKYFNVISIFINLIMLCYAIWMQFPPKDFLCICSLFDRTVSALHQPFSFLAAKGNY